MKLQDISGMCGVRDSKSSHLEGMKCSFMSATFNLHTLKRVLRHDVLLLCPFSATVLCYFHFNNKKGTILHTSKKLPHHLLINVIERMKRTVAHGRKLPSPS